MIKLDPTALAPLESRKFDVQGAQLILEWITKTLCAAGIFTTIPILVVLHPAGINYTTPKRSTRSPDRLPSVEIALLNRVNSISITVKGYTIRGI